MFSLLKKSVQRPKSPALPDIVQKGILTKSKSSVKIDESFGVEGETEAEEPEEQIDTSKPLYHDFWIRSLDPQNLVYFYNVRTGESSWLGPCGVCCRDSHKYCVDCGKSYCDTHFKKRHEKKSRQKHKWQLTDPPNPEKLKIGMEYCIECSCKVATLMCTDCWDGYCEQCFHLVHHLGDLVYHQTKPYSEAKKGWICVRGTAKEPEYYMHGETNVSTFEKPYELMTPLERRFFKQFKKVELRAQEIVKEVEKVQFEVEGTKYERDKVFYDTQSTVHELHELQVQRAKPKEGNLLDHSKLKTGGGILSTLFGVNAKEELYRDKLLNPTDRHRGEARTEYIKNVLDTTTAGIIKKEEPHSKKKSSKH